MTETTGNATFADDLLKEVAPGQPIADFYAEEIRQRLLAELATMRDDRHAWAADWKLGRLNSAWRFQDQNLNGGKRVTIPAGEFMIVAPNGMSWLCVRFNALLVEPPAKIGYTLV